MLGKFFECEADKKINFNAEQQMSVESVKDFQIHEKVKECIDDARAQIEKITGR